MGVFINVADNATGKRFHDPVELTDLAREIQKKYARLPILKAKNVLLTERNKKYQEYVIIKQRDDKPLSCGIFKVELEDEIQNKFSLEILIRVDNTHHDSTPLHLNIDLVLRDDRTGKKIKEWEGKKYHYSEIHDLIPRTFFISVVIPGRGISKRIIYFPCHKDVLQYKKSLKFLETMMNKNMSNDLKEKYLENYNKKVHKYATLIKGRKAPRVKGFVF